MKQRIICKGLAVAIILLLSLSVTPSIGMSNNDDTTPPVTVHTLNPPEPDGNNGWYVSDVDITLTATDDMSGVNKTYYRINSGDWEIYNEPFTLSKDGDDILIEYYSVDYANNVEDVKSFKVDIDQTEPEIYLYFESLGNNRYIFIVEASDEMSGMERVEFYNYSELQEVVYGSGPEYYWETILVFLVNYCGLIYRKEITEEDVRFYAIYVRAIQINYDYFSAYAYDNAGNSDYDFIYQGPPHRPKYYNLEWLTLDNDYNGYIGRFFIFATFNIIVP